MVPTLKLSALITWPSLDQVTTEPSEIKQIVLKKQKMHFKDENVSDLNLFNTE